MGQRLPVRPVLEGRPAGRVVRVRRVAPERVLERRARAARLVVGAVDERDGDAEAVPRLAAVGAAAEELERHHVHVRVDQPARLAERGRAGRRLAGHVDLGLREGRAAARPRRRRTGRAPGRVDERRALPSPSTASALPSEGSSMRKLRSGDVDPPVGGVARLGSARDALAADRQRAGDGRHEVARLAVEQVAAERGGLHPERLGAAGAGRGRLVAAVALLDDERVGGYGLERVAAVRERVAVGHAARLRRRGDRQGRQGRDRRAE